VVVTTGYQPPLLRSDSQNALRSNGASRFGWPQSIPSPSRFPSIHSLKKEPNYLPYLGALVKTANTRMKKTRSRSQKLKKRYSADRHKRFRTVCNQSARRSSALSPQYCQSTLHVEALRFLWQRSQWDFFCYAKYIYRIPNYFSGRNSSQILVDIRLAVKVVETDRICSWWQTRCFF